MIRAIIVYLVVIIVLLLSSIALLVEWIIGKINPGLKDRSSLKIVQGLFKMLLFLTGTKVTIIGKENLPTDRSVLYIGNHKSYFDILINYAYMPGLTGFISKAEIGKVPILKTWMYNVKCLFMDRDDIKQSMKVIITAIEQVKAGISIFIFPEGTRCKDDDNFLPFKAGSFKIATKSGCDIIPVSINNSASVFEKPFPKIKKAHVVVEYGAPIVVKDMDKDQIKALPELVQNTVFEMYNKNKELV